jgi:hypothetical protein
LLFQNSEDRFDHRLAPRAGGQMTDLLEFSPGEFVDSLLG